MSFNFSDDGFSEYIKWQNEDRKTLKKINALIYSIKRDGLLSGIGKPEKLKYIDGYSRRIDDANRLIYNGTSSNDFIITSCKGHYED